MSRWESAMHGLAQIVTIKNLGGFAIASVDVLVVAFLIYRLMMLAKGTRAWQIILGLVFFGFIYWSSKSLGLISLNWLLKQTFQLGPVALVILFYPEMRHALEEAGRLGFWGRGFIGLDKEEVSDTINELVRVATTLSDKKIGALVVLERETGLTDIIETGTEINALVNAEMIGTIFYPGTPLHDGAIIIRRDRVVAAGCILPLSESRNIGATIHTRHKAALGITEQSDAVALVVSEETGIITLMFDGKHVRGLRDDALRDRLLQEYLGRERPQFHRRRGIRLGLPQRASRKEAKAEQANRANTPDGPPTKPGDLKPGREPGPSDPGLPPAGRKPAGDPDPAEPAIR
jgi:diadenylate cyclase